MLLVGIGEKAHTGPGGGVQEPAPWAMWAGPGMGNSVAVLPQSVGYIMADAHQGAVRKMDGRATYLRNTAQSAKSQMEGDTEQDASRPERSSKVFL